MNSTKRTARVAGLLYLLNGLLAVFSLQYAHHTLMVHGNATATANNILASEMLFRMGIVSELISATIFVFLGLVLYRLFKGVREENTLLMLTLVLVSVPISFLNELNRIAALVLLKGADFVPVFDQHQRDVLVMVFLNLHMGGLNLVQIFWGLWLFPFGILVFKSGFLPRILGVLLIVAGFAYVGSSVTTLLSPAYGNIAFGLAAVVGGIGEGATMLWLLIKGAKDQPLGASA
jgi:hypothetical protein